MLIRSPALTGQIVTLEHTSKVLADNPLGDPHVRRFPVWLPPQYRARSRRRLPVLFDLTGFTGSGWSHVAWRNFDESVPEQAERLLRDGKLGPVIIVFPDCFTALGGNQYINSSAIGRYADYEAGLEEASKVVEAFQGYVLAHSDYLGTVDKYNNDVAKLMSVSGADE